MNSSAKGDADQHRLAARFVDGPHVSAPDKAEQRLTDWLTGLAAEQAPLRTTAQPMARLKHQTTQTRTQTRSRVTRATSDRCRRGPRTACR